MAKQMAKLIIAAELLLVKLSYLMLLGSTSICKKAHLQGMDKTGMVNAVTLLIPDLPCFALGCCRVYVCLGEHEVGEVMWL